MQKSSTKISGRVYRAILATGLMSFCGVVVETAMNITFPTLMKEFSVTTATVQWMTTVYLLVVACIVPLSAFLKSRFKTRNLFITASIFFIAGLIIDLVAPRFPVLLLGRAIQGVGTGIALPLMFNIILEQVPLAHIGTMMGIGTLITAVAPAIGPTFGGAVVANTSWRFIFATLLPIMVVALLLGIFNIDQKSKLRHVAFDTLSLVLIIVTFAGIIFGFSNLGNGAFISLKTAGAIVVGLLGLALFVLRSLRITNPIINMRTLANRAFSGHVVAFFLTQIINLGLSFILPNYIQLVNGGSALTAGLIVLPGAIIGAIFAPLGGRILDQFGPQLPLLLGPTISIVGLLIFTLGGLHISNLALAGIYFIFMIGMGLSFGNIMTNGLKQLTPEHHANGNAILTTLQQFAGAVGTSLTAAVVAISQNVPGKPLAAGTGLGSHNAFIILLCGYVVILGTLFLVLRKPGSSSNGTEI